MKDSDFFKSFGPGLLLAGSAIGVSHLVQSTRAGGEYGFSLVIFILLANLFKYPFFEFGPRYAVATGESLIEGYRRQNKGFLGIFIFLTLSTMFIIQAAVTLVTAGIATQVFDFPLPPLQLSMLLLSFCTLMLGIGKFAALDKMMKLVILILSTSTLFAVIIAWKDYPGADPSFTSPSIWNHTGIFFLIALMGWMPAPIDLAVWHSLWTLEKKEDSGHEPSLKESRLDFNIGYIGTAVMSLFFVSLGALVMHGKEISFSDSAPGFAKQLIEMYVQNLGEWTWPIIVSAAFATMFSTTLTALDAYARVCSKTFEVLFPGKKTSKAYGCSLLSIYFGVFLVLAIFHNQMLRLVDLATVLSFLSAPVLAYMNLKTVTQNFVAKEAQPPYWLITLSYMGIVFLLFFSGVFLFFRFSAIS